MNNILLGASARMKCLADCVLQGGITADIGTDHAFVPLFLIESGISPKVIATDVVPGPLQKAAANIDGREGIELRLGSGLEPIEKGEVDTVIIAGMGAELIVSILEADMDKTLSFKRFVLQPRTRTPILREWLYNNKFMSTERLVDEQGRICEVFTAEYAGEKEMPAPEDFELPESLAADPLAELYLKQYVTRCANVLDGLRFADSGDKTELLGVWTAKLEKARKWKDLIK